MGGGAVYSIFLKTITRFKGSVIRALCREWLPLLQRYATHPLALSGLKAYLTVV